MQTPSTHFLTLGQRLVLRVHIPFRNHLLHLNLVHPMFDLLSHPDLFLALLVLEHDHAGISNFQKQSLEDFIPHSQISVSKQQQDYNIDLRIPLFVLVRWFWSLRRRHAQQRQKAVEQREYCYQKYTLYYWKRWRNLGKKMEEEME